MRRGLGAMDRRLAVLGKARITALAATATVVIGYCDYLTGSEISASLFYLAPVALAAWYAGRRPGLAIAVLSCLCWYFADTHGGKHYSHPAIPVWNALIRFGFFFITNQLLSALHTSLSNERLLAQTDVLTGLLSRRAFTDRLTHDLAVAQRRAAPISLAYLDLDDFKQINDVDGHLVGDQVLRTVAHALAGAVRVSDSAARLGGDEFALILPDTGHEGAQFVVGNLARTLGEMRATGTLPLTLSIGVISALPPHGSFDELVSAADHLMYEAKRAGKGDVRFSVRGGDDRVTAI